MPNLKKPDAKQLAEWELDPYRTLKPQIERLLTDLVSDYDKLRGRGTALDYRLAVARHAADAKGILQVVDACNNTLFKRDIL
jgi:hypothetical protein